MKHFVVIVIILLQPATQMLYSQPPTLSIMVPTSRNQARTPTYTHSDRPASFSFPRPLKRRGPDARCLIQNRPCSSFSIKDEAEKLAARKAVVEGPLAAKLVALNVMLVRPWGGAWGAAECDADKCMGRCMGDGRTSCWSVQGGLRLICPCLWQCHCQRLHPHQHQVLSPCQPSQLHLDRDGRKGAAGGRFMPCMGSVWGAAWEAVQGCVMGMEGSWKGRIGG